MKLDAICGLIRHLDIAPSRLEILVRKFQQLNLCGLVLASCPLQELKDALAIPLGDWTMVKILVETLKAFGPNVPGINMNRRKALTLPEEDEEGPEVAVVVSRRDTIVQSSAEVVNSDPRRSTALSTEMNSDHKWLMESLSGMDLTQTEGDIDLRLASGDGPVRNTLEDGLASDADSTESRFGSKENLLDGVADPLLSQQSSTSNARSDLMHQIRNDSIHSADGLPSPLLSFVSSDGDHQVTVMRRDGTVALAMDRTQLTNLFSRENGNA